MGTSSMSLIQVASLSICYCLWSRYRPTRSQAVVYSQDARGIIPTDADPNFRFTHLRSDGDKMVTDTDLEWCRQMMSFYFVHQKTTTC